MDRSRLFGKEITRPEHYPHRIFEADPNLVLIANQDFEVGYLTGYSAPFTGGGKAIFPKGEKIKVTNYVKGAKAADCRPVDYERLQNIIVSEKERSDSKYTGYGLVITLVDLDRFFDEVT